MKPSKLLQSFLLAAGSSLLAVSSASGQTGTWNVDSDGLWGTNTNWLSNTIASGSGNTANFTNNITADRTVSLNTDRTLTQLVFSDSNTATAGSWILNNNGVSTNNLILAGTTPTITVNALGTGRTATISAEIQGTVGLTKGGTGTLVLSGANTYSGGTTILNGGGTLRLESLGSLGAGNVAIQTNGLNTGTLELALTGTNAITNTFSGFSSANTLVSGGQAQILNTSGTNTINSTLDIANTGGNGLNVVSNGGLLTLAGTITTDENFRVLSLGGSGNGVVSGAITQLDASADAMNVNKSGSGTWTLTNNSNTYNRRLQIYDGTIQVGNGGTTGALSGQDVIFDATATAGAKLVFNRSNSYSYGSATVEISGPGSVEQVGAGTTTLSGINTYTGTTTINAGTLAVNGSGSINNSAVTVNGGTFLYNSSVAYSGTLTFTSGTIAGTNLTGSLGNQTIGANQTVSPGNSPGTMATTGQIWAADGSYLWEINDATGTVGSDPGWDLVSGTGSLDITASLANPFDILVTSLTLGNVAGDAANFSDLSNYNWLIADFASITGFDVSDFFVNTSAFDNPFTGTFGISLGGVGAVPGDNSQIYLTYTAIPEPGAALLGSLGLLALLRRRR